MKNHVNTIIVGATYFGIGYASSHPDCLVLESSQILGGEFHQNVKAVEDSGGIGEREGNTELGRLMKKYQVWKDGKLDILKAAPVFHEYVSGWKRGRIPILLDVKVLTVRQKQDGYEVEYMSNRGISCISCEKLLDTTTLRDTYPSGAFCKEKTLNLFTLCMGDGFEKKLQAQHPECKIVDGMEPGEKFVKIPFPPEEQVTDAYDAVVDLWKKAFPDGEEKILFLACDFEYHCERSKEEQAPCAWSGGTYSNPLTAFAEGMDYQL